MRARSAAIVGVAVAFAVAGGAIIKRSRPVEVRVVETTRAIRIVRRDRSGLPDKKAVVGDPARVRALTEALGVDALPGGSCPPDYADADLGLVLAGDDVYVRRNVYVFALLGDAGEPWVMSVTSAGCRMGPAADVESLRRELRTAKILE